MNVTSIRSLLSCCALSVTLIGNAAIAADWPSQPIRIISPYPAGGSTDRIARVLAESLTAQLGVSVVVENRVGGGSTIGSAQVVRAKPDGYTLLLSGLASYVLAPVAVPEAKINPMDELTHIAYIGGAPMGVVVPANSKANSIADLVKQERAGEKLFYTTVGVGSVGHITGEQINSAAGLHMVNVPYNTLNLTDVVEGRVPVAVLAWTSVEPMVKSGRLKLLAVTGGSRVPGVDTPTLKEQGVDVDVTAWLSLSGPKGMPVDVVAKLNHAVTYMLSTPATRDKLVADVFEVKLMSPSEFEAYLRTETSMWTPRVVAAVSAGK